MTASPDSPVRVAVCGFGRAGRIHSANLLRNPLADLVAIVELESAHAASADYLRQLGVKDPAKLMHGPEAFSALFDRIDAVIVTTPTPDHESYVKAGLSAAKAVFCEKPLAPTLEATAELYKLAEKQGMPLFCSMNRRFDRTLVELRNTLASNVFGKPLVLKTVARDHPIPSLTFLKTSGGMVCWLAGGVPDEVFTMGFCHDAGIAALGDFDNLVISMKFSKPSTFMATLDLSRHGSYGYDQRVEILCERGMLESQAQRQTGLAITASSSTDGFHTGTVVAPILTSFPQRYAESYKAAIDHFLKLVKSYRKHKGSAGFDVIVPGKDVIRATLIADAAEKSLKTGKAVRIDYETLTFN